MKFGYFTLSDNHYPGNPRTANRFVEEIRDQAIHVRRDAVRMPESRYGVVALLVGDDEDDIGSLGHAQPFTAPESDWTI